MRGRLAFLLLVLGAVVLVVGCNSRGRGGRRVVGPYDAGTTCRGAGLACTSGTQCCFNTCTGGYCAAPPACGTTEDPCVYDSDCCEGYGCVEGSYCAPTAVCGTYGSSCAYSSDCCAGYVCGESGYCTDEVLCGGFGCDDLRGGASDHYLADAGDDCLCCGEGDDALLGGDGNDYFAGEPGCDLVICGDGANDLYGNANDVFIAARPRSTRPGSS